MTADPATKSKMLQKKKKQKIVRPLFLEPEPLPPAIPSPQPLPPLPISPPHSPAHKEEEETTIRPNIIVDLPYTKREIRKDIYDIPWVDPCICSPGFRPVDDLIVKNKHNRWEEEEEYEEEYEEDEDGWCYYQRRGFWSPPKAAFTEERGKQMVKQFSKLIDCIEAALLKDKNAGIERFLDAMVCSDYMDEFLRWAPRFCTMLEAKITEFCNHPRAPLRIIGLCQLLRDRHF